MLFEPFTIKNVAFKNRVLRSSLGGKMSYYDGTVSPTWARFERRFAEAGVGGIISTTITVDDRRWSPLEYPKISHDRCVAPIREGVAAVQALGCRYILQLGDPGAHTQLSLLPQAEDHRSASSLFDLVFGYGNRSSAMTVEEIQQTVQNFADGARRAQEAGCDGIEITAAKGYLIHQFLNPATNRRSDAYGGSVAKRFQLLREIIQAVRRTVGPDFLLGVRLSAVDRNYLPVNARWPLVFPLQHYLSGNGLKETVYYGQELARLGTDYLHITSGFGFIHPGDSTGRWPVDEFRMYANATRHLSAKANFRATLLNALPRSVAAAVFGLGWQYRPAANASYAAIFRQKVGLPVIANGGFERQDIIERALSTGQCDMVAMARPLLANPNLLSLFQQGINEPPRPCTHCNRCSVATGILPLGCYDRSRFDTQEAMEAQIMWWSGGPHVEADAKVSQSLQMAHSSEKPLPTGQAAALRPTLTAPASATALADRPLPYVPGVEHRFVQVNGMRMHVAEAGQGEPLVLLHGWPQHWYEWRFQIPTLAQHYRVICPDLRGFGWTDAPADGYDKETLTTDTIALLDALGLGQVRFMGHDWGGWIGFLIGLRQPDRIRQHLALNIPPIWPTFDWRAVAATARFTYMYKIAAPIYGDWLIQHRPDFVHDLLTRFTRRPGGWPQAELTAFSSQFQDPARAQASVKLYRTFLLREFFPILFGRYQTQRLKTPTLLLFGTDDFALSTSWLRGYEPYVDDFKIELLPHVSHFIVEEQPDLVTQRALKFFGAQ